VLRVGLTGGIACGKSHVLRELEARGCQAIDLDKVAHDMLEPGAPGFAPVVATFGRDILGPDGRIDRKQLGARVFGDAAALARLNAIVHPLVRLEEEHRVLALEAVQAELVVTDAALLVEAGLLLHYDRLVVVHCAPSQQLERLMARDGLTSAAAQARIAAQLPLLEKRRFAHLEIDTSSSLAASEAAAHALAAELHALARQRPTPVVVSREWLKQRPSLAAAALLDAVALEGAPNLQRLAGLAADAPASAWLARGKRVPSAALPLLRPLVAYCLARRGDDVDHLGLAARALARAHTEDAPSVAAVCARALETRGSALGTIAPIDAAAFGARWGGSPPAELAASADEHLDADALSQHAAAVDRFLASAERLGRR
jgi:dephospho-CoA kinase